MAGAVLWRQEPTRRGRVVEWSACVAVACHATANWPRSKHDGLTRVEIAAAVIQVFVGHATGESDTAQEYGGHGALVCVRCVDGGLEEAKNKTACRVLRHGLASGCRNGEGEKCWRHRQESGDGRGICRCRWCRAS